MTERRADETPAALPEPGRPPTRAIVALTWVACLCLLFYPLHVPYQNPDQDFATQNSVLEFVRGDWSPISLHYPSALTNILRVAYRIGLEVAKRTGHASDRVDVLIAWERYPDWFRVLPRLIAIGSACVSLAVARRLAALVAGPWAGLAAMALLGSSLMFVREGHHGMYDAPAAAAMAAALYLSARHVRSGSARALIAAGAAVGAALSFKQNGGLAALAVMAAAALGPGSAARRFWRLTLAGAVALLVLFATSPAIFLEAGRFVDDLRMTGQVLFGTGEGFPPGVRPFGLAQVMRYGLGIPLLVAAGVGVAVAARDRERALVPLLVFAAVWAAVVARGTFALNRYGLALAMPIAVLAALALLRLLPSRGALAATAALVAFQLASTLPYLRLLGVTDTRVLAARWLERALQHDEKIVMPGGDLWYVYVGPTLMRPLELEKFLPPHLAAAARERAPEPFPREWEFARFLNPERNYFGRRARILMAGHVVVTAEHDDPVFSEVATDRSLIDYLERHGRLLADFPNERYRAPRVYEPGDYNFAPLVGASSLLRPGPRIRVWVAPEVTVLKAAPRPVAPRDGDQNEPRANRPDVLGDQRSGQLPAQ